MGTTESFTVAVLSTASPEQVYALLEDGAHWSAWAGPTVTDSRWEKPGEPVGGVGAVRMLGSWPLASHEEVVVHDPPRRHAFTSRSALPIRDHQGEITLNLTADGGTRIEWHTQFVAPLPWTGGLLRRLSERTVMSIARHLALAAVTAKPTHGAAGSHPANHPAAGAPRNPPESAANRAEPSRDRS